MKIMFVSLGCDKNLVDTENMLGILRNRGFEFTDDEYEADVIAVNTCCFIHDAKQESIDTILEMAEHKKDGKCKALIVSGCLAHRYHDEIEKEIPEVDALLGTASYDKIAEVVLSVLEGKGYSCIDDADRLVMTKDERIITTGGYYEYLKIAEGCDKHCTYCIIPKVRGNYRSYPMEYLVKQAEQLAEKGVKELILVAQETTVYGVDIYGKKMLAELVKKLAAIKDIAWIRILYCYPEEIDDALIEVIKNEPKVCHYLDKDHEEMLDFVDEMEFDRLGVFTYSPEEDTPAAVMPDQIDEEVKEQRRDAVMELQQEVSLDKSEEMVGKVIDCLIEGKIEDDDTYVGRSYKDAPNVDGFVFVKTDANLMSGDIVKVRIDGAMEYDLIGSLCD